MRPVYALAEYCAAPDSDRGNPPTSGYAEVRDLTAFREVVEGLQGKIFSVSYALLGSVPEADVTAQKVLVRLYRTARPVARQDLIQYTYRLAINQCLIDLRLRHVRRFFAWFRRSAPVPDRGGLAATDEFGERNLVLGYLTRLPRRERALLVLREVAGQPVEAVAEIMNMKPGAVRKQLFSARRRLLTVVPAVNKQPRLS